MRVVAANTALLLVCFERSSGGAGVLIAEDYVIVHEVADSLYPWPTEWDVSEEPAKPRRIDDRSHSNDCQAKTA